LATCERPRQRQKAKDPPILKRLDPSSFNKNPSRSNSENLSVGESSSRRSPMGIASLPLLSAPLGAASLPILASPTVARQVSYHWRTVQRVTLKSRQHQTMAKSQSCREFGTQTDQIVKQQPHLPSKIISKEAFESSVATLSAMSTTLQNSIQSKLNRFSTPSLSSRLERPGSIMSQVEALKPKAPIKHQVIQEITRRASLGSAMTSLSRAFSSESYSEMESVKSQDLKVSKSVSLPSRRHFLNPTDNDRNHTNTEQQLKEDDEDQISAHTGKGLHSDKNDSETGQIVAKIHVKKPLRRSNTQIEMSQHSKLSHILSRRFKFIVNNVAADPVVKEKKDLEKMWQQAYLGMCNRAVVLNHVILKAEQEESTVKPVSLSEVHHPAKPVKSGSIDKHYVGLDQQFYHVDPVGEGDSSLEELDIRYQHCYKNILSLHFVH
jgi:hypothetical protein